MKQNVLYTHATEYYLTLQRKCGLDGPEPVLSEKEQISRDSIYVTPWKQASLPRKVSARIQGNGIADGIYRVQIFFVLVKIIFKWAGGFSQQPRELAILTEDLSLVPNTPVSS